MVFGSLGLHHSVPYRFLSRASWCKDQLGKALFQALLPFLPDEIELPLDDTLKRGSGPHLFGAGMHFDAHTSTYSKDASGKRQTFFRFGHNWVILSAYVPLPWNPRRGLAVPVLFRLYRPKRRCPEADFKKRTALALELVKLVSTWFPEGRWGLVITDSEYACETLLKNFPANLHFVGPMAMNAAQFEPPPEYSGFGRPRRKGAPLRSSEQLAGSQEHPWEERVLQVYGKTVTFLYKTQTCLWYNVAAQKLLRMVVTRDPSGRIEDRAYFCTDPQRSPDDFLVSFSHRWTRECAIRDAKQFIGIEHPQNGWWRRPHKMQAPPKKSGPDPHPVRGRSAVERTFPLAFISYGIVILWYLHHGHPQRDVEIARAAAPWYRHKAQPSFDDMLAALRREIWLDRLSAHPPLRTLRRKVVAFIQAWLWAA